MTDFFQGSCLCGAVGFADKPWSSEKEHERRVDCGQPSEEDTGGITPSIRETEMRKTNNITIGSMQNSQVQQDAEHSVQKIEQGLFEAGLNNFLENFIRDISKVDDQTTAKALLADVETIKSQSNSPSPKKGIVKECLLSIKNVLEGAAGSVLASYIPMITPLLACL